MMKFVMSAALVASWPLVASLGVVAWSCDRAAARLRLAQSALRHTIGASGQEAPAAADRLSSEELAWNGAAAKIVAIGRARTLRALRRSDRVARLAEEDE